jgi:hypothetical protein
VQGVEVDQAAVGLGAFDGEEYALLGDEDALARSGVSFEQVNKKVVLTATAVGVEVGKEEVAPAIDAKALRLTFVLDEETFADEDAVVGKKIGYELASHERLADGVGRDVAELGPEAETSGQAEKNDEGKPVKLCHDTGCLV